LSGYDLSGKRHRFSVPVDHWTRTVSRVKLEYPAHGVSYAYLACINMLMYCQHSTWCMAIVTRDSFPDKAVLSFMLPGSAHFDLYGRLQDRYNFYHTTLYPNTFELGKRVNNVLTVLASESVSIDGSGRGLCLSITGSSPRAMRFELPTPTDPLRMPSPARTLTATDTTFANGRWGYRNFGEESTHGFSTPDAVYLMNPMSPSPQPVAYYEVPVVGSGTEEDPYRVQMPEQVEMDWGRDPLVKRKYDVLKSRGFTDEEIEVLVPEVSFCRVNRLGLTVSSLIVTEPSGKPREYTAVVRVFADDDGNGVLKPLDVRLRALERIKGVRRLSREEAIEKARRMDDKLHLVDLLPMRRADKRVVREYVEWRLSLGVKPEQIDEQVVTRYVMEEKGW